MEKSLKVLMISSDRNILNTESGVAKRMIEYGSLVGELHIVLLCDSSHKLSELQLSKNVWVYPTNSLMSITRPIDAIGLGKRIVREKGFIRGASIITADSIETGWVGFQIKKKWHLPLELQLHTNPFSKHFKGFQNQVRRLFVGTVVKNADSIRVVSQELKNKVATLTAGPIVVLPIYVDRQKIETWQESFDVHARYGWSFVILVVARLAPEKNIDLAIKALVLVRNKFPDTGLLIVGNGPEESRLRGLVKQYDQQGFVEFAGWQNDLSSFYKTSNIFLQTSLFEGYGLALVEAGLSKLPVVTTKVGLAVELRDRQDALLVDNSPQIIAENILELIGRNNLRENLSSNLYTKLASMLPSKEEYLNAIQDNWTLTASKSI